MTTSTLRWQDACWVFLGGSIGTLLRALLLLPVDPGWAGWVVVAINIVGAFALGALNGRLGGRRDGPARRARLLLGTGVLGGFTTFSTFAFIASGGWWIVIGIATMIAGVAAAFAGLRLGGGRRR